MGKVIYITEEQANALVDERWETIPGHKSSEIDDTQTPPESFILKAYKLVRVDPNSQDRAVYPLFVNSDGEKKERWEIGKWYRAGEGDHKVEIDDVTGLPTGKVKVTSRLGNLAYRPGLHFGTLPYAPHIYSRKDNFFDDDFDGFNNTPEGTVYGKTNRYYNSLSKKEQQKFRQDFDYSKTRNMKPYTAWAECEITYSIDDQEEATQNGNYVNSKGKTVNNARNSMLQKLPKYGYKYKTNSQAPDNQTWYISNMMRIIRILSDEEVKSICEKEGITALDRTEKLDLSHLQEGRTESNFKVYITEAIDETFSFEELSSIPSFRGRYQYCVNHLGQQQGKGSSRVCFQIDDNKILKLAYNEKGIAQNAEEVNSGAGECDLTPKIYDSDREDKWIVAEYVLPAKKQDFKVCIGLSWDEFQRYIETCFKEKGLGTGRFTPYTWDELEEFDDNNDYLNQWHWYISNYDCMQGDMTAIRNFGMTMRDGEPMIVFLDSGLSEDVWNQYYSRR